MSNQYWLHQPTSNAQQSAQQQQEATSYWNQINIGGPGAQSLSQPQTARAAQPSSLWVQESITPVPTVDAQHQHIAQPQAQQHLVQPQQHHQPIIPPQVKHHQSVVSAAPLVTDGSSSTISSRGKVSHAAVAHVAPLASAPIQVDQPQNSENTLAPPQEEAAPLTPEPSSPPHYITTSTPIGNPVEMHIPTSDESGQTISSNPRQEEERDSHSSMVIVDRNDVADADTANRETIQAQQQQMVQNQQVPPGQSSAIESQDEDRSIAGSTRGGTKGAKSASANIRERYKNVCKEYSNIMERMDRYRKETPTHLDWRTAPKNPLTSMAAQNPLFTRASIGNSSCRLNESSLSSIRKTNDTRNMGNPAPNYPPPSEVDEDDIAEMLRRTRHDRASERQAGSERPSSRARSEYGDTPAATRAPRRVNTMYNGVGAPAYPNNFYAVSGYGHHYNGAASGRYTPNGQLYYESYHYNQAPRRPMSSFEPTRRYAASVQGSRSNNAFNDFDRRSVRNVPPVQPGVPTGGYEADSYSDDDSRVDESEMGSEEELEMYHPNQPMMSQPYFMNPQVMQDAQQEQYYFGVVKLNLQDVQAKLRSNPPPEGYYQLQPIVRAAFMFYFELYNKHYLNVAEFNNVFNREFYKYKCQQLTDVAALEKICEHTQIEYNDWREKNKLRNRRAYDLAQRQLFSDDRETPDMSDRGSVYDHVDDSIDLASIDSSVKEPLKFRERHAFVNFGPGGRMVILDPQTNMYAVQMTNFRDFVDCPQVQNLAENMEIFKGPLIHNETQPHTVRLFIDRQIARIKNSDLIMANPSSSDANDCLLIWELLQMMVQQQGRVTGPDLAQLLVRNSGAFNHQRSVRGSSFADNAGSTSTLSLADSDGRRVDGNAYERFTSFLLGGHINEAIENAIKDGMYADAFVLARRLYPNDPSKLDEIETKLLAQRPAQSPILTLLSVASGESAAVLTNPTDDPALWRAHAAIVLANLTTGIAPHAYANAMNTVYYLGRALARRDFHCAADFCLLAVNLLADMDPFRPVTPGVEDEQNVRQHIDLIHASIPDDHISSNLTPFGWSLTDFQATEIYTYVMRFRNNGLSALNYSVAFQTCRMQYAQMMAEMGGMATDAYRCYFDILMTIWNNWHIFPVGKLLEMCDVADRLKFVACANEEQIQRFNTMKETLVGYLKSKPQEAVAAVPTSTQQVEENREAKNDAEGCWVAPSIIANPLTMVLEPPVNPVTSMPVPPTTEVIDLIATSEPTSSNTCPAIDDPPLPPALPQSPVQNQPLIKTSDTFTNSEAEEAARIDTTNLISRMSIMEDSPFSSSVPMPIPTQHVVENPGAQVHVAEDGWGAPPIVTRRTSNTLTNSEASEAQSHTNSEAQSYARSEAQSHTNSEAQSHTNSEEQTVVEKATSQPQQSTVQSAAGNSEKKAGWLSGFAQTIAKAIPSRNQMILPDDSNPSIQWDEKKQRWVGDGVEQLEDVAPPPTMPAPTMNAIPAVPTAASMNTAPSGGIQRRTRYVNAGAFMTAPSTASNNMPSMALPTAAFPAYTSSLFIPQAPEGNEESEGAASPFAPSPTTEGSS